MAPEQVKGYYKENGDWLSRQTLGCAPTFYGADHWNGSFESCRYKAGAQLSLVGFPRAELSQASHARASPQQTSWETDPTGSGGIRTEAEETGRLRLLLASSISLIPREL